MAPKIEERYGHLSAQERREMAAALRNIANQMEVTAVMIIADANGMPEKKLWRKKRYFMTCAQRSLN